AALAADRLLHAADRPQECRYSAAAHLHLLRAHRARRHLRPVRPPVPLRRRLAALRDRRQPQPQRDGARGAGQHARPGREMSSDATRRARPPAKPVRAIPAPEPDLAPKELIARAVALRERIRAEQDASEARGCHSPELQEAFVKAGFYRTLQPKRFGGYELDYPTFYKAMIEISRGDPGVGWCVILGATHGAQVASHWPEQAQMELFGPEGHFIAPHRAQGPAGKCRRVDGGYHVEGVWSYASGVPYSTHFIGNVMVEGTSEQIVFIV